MIFIILAILLTTLLYIAAVKGWIVNMFYTLATIIDAFKDIACQLWLDVEKIWKREEEPVVLDEHETKLS